MNSLSYMKKAGLQLALSLLRPTPPPAGVGGVIFDLSKKARPMEQTLACLPHYSAEEYFALEEKSPVRHEFFEGEVFAMAGASIAHNTIAGNVYMACRQALRGQNCRVQMEAVRLAVEENRHYAYPDVMVSCDPHDQHESQQLHSPLLLVEVLSPSTEAYDRGLKFNQYKKLPSLRHYLLVSQKTGSWSGTSSPSMACGATPPWPKQKTR